MGICGSKDDVAEATTAPAPVAAPEEAVVVAAPAPVKESPPPTHFTAEIGFVVKSRMDDESKVFVNVFHHSSVLYIATTLAEKFTTDKSGGSTLTYDVVINTAVFTICSADDDSKEYVSEQIIEYINNNITRKLSLEFKIPRMKRGYVGNDIPHMKIPEPVTERLVTERSEEELAMLMTKENVAAAAAVESSEMDSANSSTAAHNPTLDAVVAAEQTNLTRSASSLNSQVLQAAVSDAEARSVTRTAPVVTTNTHSTMISPISSPAAQPQKTTSVCSSGGSTDKRAPLTFSGYALKKSGSSFVGLQTRFFHLSEHGVISYYQTVSETTVHHSLLFRIMYT